MELKLKRHPQSPLMYPNPLHRWEALNVFNPAVIRHNGLFHMWYRAQGVDLVSSIGYAVSADGLHWNRLTEPVLAPHMGEDDRRGVEDPRVTPPDGAFWRVGLEDPLRPQRNLAIAEIRDPALAGAIATSGRNKRRWATDHGVAHHLIDPRTGLPARGSIETATVFAADATTADIAAKILFLAHSLTGEAPLNGGALGVTFDDRGFGTRWEGTHADAVTIIPLVVRTDDAS